MTADQQNGTSRGDRMTTDFFENVLTEYLENDRIESGVLRLELDDGRTRRLVVDDDTESLDAHEYTKRELEEMSYLIEENEELFDEPVELSIPVADEDRVVEEATEDGAVRTLFGASGIQTLLDQLHALADENEVQSSQADTAGD